MLRSAPSPFSASLVKNPRVQRKSPLPGPAPMNDRSTPYRGSHAVNRRYSVAYSSAVRLPPQPHVSLPTPQKRTRNGSLSPDAALSSASVEDPAGLLQYSTH